MDANYQDKKRVPITKLAVGDFVEAVTKQLGDVSVVQTGLVRNHFALQSLKKKGVIEVLVDPSRSKKQTLTDKDDNKQKADINSVIVSCIEWQVSASQLFEETLFRAASGLPIDLLSLEHLAMNGVQLTEKHHDSLALVVRCKLSDNGLASHLIRTAISLAQFSIKNNYPKKAAYNLVFAALLSRIGFHLLPASLQKPTSKLAPLAQLKKQKHLEQLFKLLSLSGQPNQQVTKLLQEQNELLDGSGYPNQLDNDSLNSAQKVMSIALQYDSLLFGFDQIKSIGSTAAFRALMDRSPANFDPDILQAFIQAIGLYPAGTLVKLHSGRIALVIENQKQLTKPKVKAFYNGEFNHHIASKVFDLAESDDAVDSTVKAQRYNLEVDELISTEGI